MPARKAGKAGKAVGGRKRKPVLTGAERRAKVHIAYDAAIAAGDPDLAAKIMKKAGMKPIPESFKGPGRTGNKRIEMDRETGTEITRPAGWDFAYARFLEGVEEGELLQALATAPGPPDLGKNKYQQALLMLTHPAYKRATRRTHVQPGDSVSGQLKAGQWSVAAIMKHAGVTLPDLMDVYGRYRVAQAVRIAMDQAPVIMGHTADDARNRKVSCTRCDGYGVLDLSALSPIVVNGIPELTAGPAAGTLRTCPECEGTGKITQSGDNEARKLVLEVAGITNKRGPMVDARSVHYGHGVFSVESLVKGMEQMEQPVIMPPAQDTDIIDAETEEAEGAQ